MCCSIVMINAREAYQQTGAGSCVSTLCGWSHSTCEVRLMNNTSVVIMIKVKPAFSSDIRFKGCNTRERNAGLHSKQHC